ncbi:hypothetical protein CRG98_010449 [Punica granatum]|uniref:Uncharacterized protein n=1 Tax=Punica granatum TaxID=22663 RepID=A0A2I0KKY8_PUNGR|nr:hypothetical protein CRG98_010449 [Punica granatum]
MCGERSRFLGGYSGLFRGGGLSLSSGSRAFPLSGQIRGGEWRRPNNSSNSKRDGASCSARLDLDRPTRVRSS